jgi:predicted ATPase
MESELRYIYMDNFRGFTETLVPLRQINFLVGENSTGKSSFLSLLSLVNQPSFWFNPVFAMGGDSSPSSFADVVSAWAKDKATFQVGVVTTSKDKSGKIKLSFTINEFSERDDNPKLSRHSKLSDKHITTILFEKKRTKYKIDAYSPLFDSEEQAISAFKQIMAEDRAQLDNFKFFPKDVPPNSPLPIAVSILQSIESGESIPKAEFKIEIPMGQHVTWIAPIRTKPKRIYDGINVGYSPEGEHAPLLLRKSLRSRSGSKKFADRLKEFGESSGLFETVVAHSFGKGAKDPFELLIKFNGAELNINNVGYGVSQALPLIVEFLTSEKTSVFAVQQPEVHLHPRAQAALGSLVFELANQRKQAFFIETHSDYLIDRYRLSMKSKQTPPASQMLFFKRTPIGNQAHSLPISAKGLYPQDQPKEFRDFFVREEIKLLDI